MLGRHRIAFECDSFEDLNASYPHPKGAGIVPEFCLDSGMSFSSHYRDPDGDRLELQVGDLGLEGPPIELPQVRA
jgi:hypothetical protein